MVYTPPRRGGGTGGTFAKTTRRLKWAGGEQTTPPSGGGAKWVWGGAPDFGRFWPILADFGPKFLCFETVFWSDRKMGVLPPRRGGSSFRLGGGHGGGRGDTTRRLRTANVNHYVKLNLT